jgi:hypothetical protein
MKKIYLLLIVCILLCFSCKKDENGNWITYYKTIGEGYIVEKETNKPIRGSSFR